MSLQPQLMISQPGDKYEREAEHVMSMPAPGLQRQAVAEEEEEGNGLQTKPLLQQQVNSGVQTYPEAPAIVWDVLRSPGRPLDLATRAFMEPRIGHDFSQVRIHTGTQAGEAARAVNAQAFTVGRDIVFEVGQYSPGSEMGRRLLAHELTHTIQQNTNDVVQTLLKPTSQREKANTFLSPVGWSLEGHNIISSIMQNSQNLITATPIGQVCANTAGSEKLSTVPIIQHRTSTLVVQRTPPPKPTPEQPIINKNIILTSQVGPTFHPCGHGMPQFVWGVNFSPTAKAGWIVQRIKSTYIARNCDGTPNECDGTVNATFAPMPEYWEAWKIASGGPIPAYPEGHDKWLRSFDNPTCGNWSMEGTLYIAETLPMVADGDPKGFAVGNVPEAHDALSTVHQPPRAVLGRSVGNRRISVEWNCCPNAANQYHRQTKLQL